MSQDQKVKIWSALCYLPPLFLPLLFFKRRTPLIYSHAKQALVTWIFLGLAYVISLLPGPLFAVGKWPVSIGLGILFLLHLAMGLATAVRGQAKPLPLGEWIDNLPIFSSSETSGEETR
ncbi:MAG: hypothetical protein ACOX2G_07275 [Bacillota bacterium]|jgi:uncharacterized membrane protein